MWPALLKIFCCCQTFDLFTDQKFVNLKHYSFYFLLFIYWEVFISCKNKREREHWLCKSILNCPPRSSACAPKSLNLVWSPAHSPLVDPTLLFYAKLLKSNIAISNLFASLIRISEKLSEGLLTVKERIHRESLAYSVVGAVRVMNVLITLGGKTSRSLFFYPSLLQMRCDCARWTMFRAQREKMSRNISALLTQYLSLYLEGCRLVECAHEMLNDASVNCWSIIHEFHQTMPEITSVVNSIDLEARLWIKEPPSPLFYPPFPPPCIYANVCRCTHHEGDGEVVQSGGWVIMVQVGVQVPWRRVGGHGLDSELPVDEGEKEREGEVCDRRAREPDASVSVCGAGSCGEGYRPCSSLLGLPGVGRHGLRHVDVVAVAVVGVHSVGVRRGALVRSSAGVEK